MKPFAGFFLALIVSSVFSSVYANNEKSIKLIYFFSSSCKHCIESRPVVINLSETYPIEGIIFGKVSEQSLPFSVREGNKEQAKKDYGIAGIPTIAVFVNGLYKQKIEGSRDIQHADVVIKALAKGALTVTEAAKLGASERVTITGWLVNKGDYFKNANFVITDRRENIRVKPWLPLEAAKSPLKKVRPRIMSDVLNKPTTLRGTLVKKDQGLELVVKEEVSFDY